MDPSLKRPRRTPAGHDGWRRWWRWCAFPLGLAVAAVAAVALVRGALSPAAAPPLVFGLALVLVWISERVVPFATVPPSARVERRADVLSFATVFAVLDPVRQHLLLPWLASVGLAAGIAGGGAAWWPHAWPLWLQVVAAALLVELLPYLLHRMAHRGGWMWRAHAFHHAPDHLRWLNGFRVHPLNFLWYQLAGFGVGVLVGVPPLVLQVVLLFATVTSVFQHANADLRLGGWNLVFSTTDLHRWHHAADVAEAQCNFGAWLSVWDHVFGTWRRPSAAPARLGLDLPPRSFRQWLLHPLRAAARPAAARPPVLVEGA